MAGAFLGVYVVMFLVRFWLLNRLFARLHRRDRAKQHTPSETSRRAS